MFLPRARSISCHSHEFDVHICAHLHKITYFLVLMPPLRLLIELLLNYSLNTRNAIGYIRSLHLSASYVANATSYLRPHVARLRATHGITHTGRQVSTTHAELPRH
ncbi:hypothetical protein F383_16685 [Gossypium arboreum]|uniref:Uncharacterized protein n=1 Tax=Gossypium arboreum TaxID=29729 RepID=A0A0B0NPK3_GOSAR|nr:hypothetical protein F383_16685 [Gossypium arboreum]